MAPCSSSTRSSVSSDAIDDSDETSSIAQDEPWKEPSLFPHLLNSYGVPQVSDLAPLNAYIDDIRFDIEDTKREMALLRSRFQQLHEKVASLEPKYSAHRSILAPWRKLPAEIMAWIFKLVVGVLEDDAAWEEAITTGKPKGTNIGQPLALAAVCGKWRDIALTTPQLWSYIVLNYGPYGARDPRTQHRRLPPADKFNAPLSEQLKRSKNADLSIIIYNPPKSNEKLPLTNILAHAARRIRYLHIPIATLGPMYESDFAHLSSLTINGPMELKHLSYNTTWTLAWTLNSPQLKHLRLQNCGDFSRPPIQATAFSWRQLASLTIEVWSLDGFVKLMKEMSNSIVHLVVKNDILQGLLDPVQALVDTQGVICMHKLESLKLFGGLYPWALSHLISTPSLLSLDIELLGCEGPLLIRNLIDRSSSPKVLSLRIMQHDSAKVFLTGFRDHLSGLGIQKLDIIHLGRFEDPDIRMALSADIEELIIRNAPLSSQLPIDLAESELGQHPHKEWKHRLKRISVVRRELPHSSSPHFSSGFWMDPYFQDRMDVLRSAGLDIQYFHELG